MRMRMISFDQRSVYTFSQMYYSKSFLYHYSTERYRSYYIIIISLFAHRWGYLSSFRFSPRLSTKKCINVRVALYYVHYVKFVLRVRSIKSVKVSVSRRIGTGRFSYATVTFWHWAFFIQCFSNSNIACSIRSRVVRENNVEPAEINALDAVTTCYKCERSKRI